MSFAGNSQIIDLYETSGLQPAQIAEAIGMDVLAIKAVLQQGSAHYREVSAIKQELAYSDAEANEAKEVALALMRHSEDDRLRAKIALRIIDDKKGRLEPQNTANTIGGALANLNINVQVLQQQIEAGRQALQISQKTEGGSPAQTVASVPIPEKELKMLQDARSKR